MEWVALIFSRKLAGSGHESLSNPCKPRLLGGMLIVIWSYCKPEYDQKWRGWLRAISRRTAALQRRADFRRAVSVVELISPKETLI
jgi:hypothetical protein